MEEKVSCELKILNKIWVKVAYRLRKSKATFLLFQDEMVN